MIDRLIERWVKKPEKILVETIRERGIASLSEDQFEAFVPMAYKFFEAAKQGEHEKNLRILGQLIAGELEESPPRPEAFLFASDAISGMSEFELKVFSCSYEFIDKCPNPIADDNDHNGLSSNIDPLPGIAEPSLLINYFGPTIGSDLTAVEDALASLTNRSLMYSVPTFDMSRQDHTGYRLTQSGREIIDKARIKSQS